MMDTILFDFDGTVMNTNEVIVQSWQYAMRTIKGEEGSREEIYKTFGEPIEITCKKFFPNTPVEESAAIYRSYHKDNFGDMISVFPGMRELLKDTKDRGYKTGLVTSRRKPTTMEGLERYKLKDFFDDVLTIEDCTKHKPDPEPINLMLERLDSKAENALMVGDTLFDIMCAKNAGVKTMLVGWAKSVEFETLPMEKKPDYILDEPNNFLSIIGK